MKLSAKAYQLGFQLGKNLRKIRKAIAEVFCSPPAGTEMLFAMELLAR